MARMLKMTEEYRAKVKEEFLEALDKVDVTTGKISFTKTFEDDGRKAVVYFSPIAWVKMVMLIQEFSKEVAWHGVARRVEDESRDEYVIDDILVYPQMVTGATVNTDQEKYEQWLYEQEDDVFNNIRMQGHSHVNMSTSPSGVDLTHQEKILDQLEDDMFYIFMIWNKSFRFDVKIYDMKKNCMFDNTNTSVKMFGGAVDLNQFISDAKDMVRDRVYTYGGQGQKSAPASPASNVKPLPASSGASPSTPTNPTERPKSQIGAGWRGKDNVAPNGDGRGAYGSYDDYDDYYNHYYGG